MYRLPRAYGLCQSILWIQFVLLVLLDMKSTSNVAYHLRRMQGLGLLGERASERECWRKLADLPQPPEPGPSADR